MRTERPKVALILTANKRRRLDSLAHRSRSAPHVAVAVEVVDGVAEGSARQDVATRFAFEHGRADNSLNCWSG
jgi:hypothetical protein